MDKPPPRFQLVITGLRTIWSNNGGSNIPRCLPEISDSCLWPLSLRTRDTATEAPKGKLEALGVGDMDCTHDKRKL